MNDSTPRPAAEDAVRGMLRSAAKGAPTAAALDVPRVVAKSRRRRRTQRLVTAGVGAAVVAASGATVLAVATLPSGSGQVVTVPTDSAAGNPAAGGDPAGGDASSGISLAPVEKVNGCGGPLSELAPVESGLVATPRFPESAPATGAEVQGVVVLTNTGTERAVGWTQARPAVTVSENGITVWHSNGPMIQVAVEIDLDPGESMELPASLSPVRCDTVDEESESFREDLPPLAPGTYGVSAIVPFYPEDSSAPQYAGGPLTSITLQ
ncbi:hypothetical protein [Naasia sp. SYSU D00948]|uniref:hypothetical protein n=1 Tax=Naasia sp. SYSU D00948 TaxID=2817379 RepID=UPI001B3153F3|nr:hypothetical protein [Naasia sp. SYSU D00948]